MSVLSFRRRSNVAEQQLPAGDWQDDELSQIFAAYRMLAQNGVPIGLDRGQTDAGEPWVVFFDLNTQDVFLHVARIGGAYVLACEALGVTLSGARLSGLLQTFEAEMRRYLAVELGKNDNVITHPAARLMITMTAVFLLSRMDNSDVAFAQDQDNKTERKAADASTIGRAQKIVTKLYEAADTPTTIAAIAGILVSMELLGSKPQKATADVSDQANDWMAQLSERKKMLAADSAPHVAQNDLAHAIVPPEHEIGVEAVELAVGNPGSLVTPASVDLSVGLTGKLLVDSAARKGQDVVLQRDDGAEPAPIALYAEDQTAETVAQEEASKDQASETVSRVKDAVAEPDHVVMVVRDDEPASSAAIDLIQTLFVEEAVSLVILPATEPIDTGDVVVLQELPVEDYVETAYSIDDLAQISGTAGFVHSTSFAKALSVEMLRHVIDMFDAYEVEVADQVVLIEQRLGPDVDAGSIGIWTNRMSDGSEVTVLGQIDLIIDAKMLFDVA